MDKKIIAGIGVLLVIVIVYFVFFSQPKQLTFSEGIKEINGLWVKNNVDSSYLISSDSSIKFSVSDLEALDADLLGFQESLAELEQTKDAEALNDFVEIHLLLVDELVLALEVKEKNDALKSAGVTSSNMCSYKDDLKFVGENTILLNEKMSNVNDLVNAFDEVHPGFKEQANLTAFIVDDSGFAQIKLENENALDELERVC